MSTSPVNALGTIPDFTAQNSNASAQTAGNPAQDLANQNVFLQLLVAQLKNQSPDNPADGTQFVTQLAQFVTLEQQTKTTTDVAAIRKLLEDSAAAQSAAAASVQPQSPAAGSASTQTSANPTN